MNIPRFFVAHISKLNIFQIKLLINSIKLCLKRIFMLSHCKEGKMIPNLNLIIFQKPYRRLRDSTLKAGRRKALGSNPCRDRAQPYEPYESVFFEPCTRKYGLNSLRKTPWRTIPPPPRPISLARNKHPNVTNRP